MSVKGSDRTPFEATAQAAGAAARPVAPTESGSDAGAISPVPDGSGDGVERTEDRGRALLDPGSHAGALPPLPFVTASGPRGSLGRAAPTEFTHVVRENFEAWDQDGDELLSMDDVRAAVEDPNNTGARAEALAAMVRRFEELHDLSDDQTFFESGIHRGDLERLEEMAVGSDAEKAEARVYASRMRYARGRIRGTNRSLFADPMAGPNYEALRQGMIGDCWVLAGLSALAENDPMAIVDMIEERRDGASRVFRVSFPGQQTVVVRPPTDAELGFLGTAGRDGLWVPVIEKAVGQLQQREDSAWPWPWGADDAELDTERISDGGPSSRGIRFLTGRRADVRDTARGRRRPSDAAFMRTLHEADREGRLMVAVRRNAGDGTDIPKRHAYSVLRVDSDAGTVTIRNPWGRGEHEGSNGRARDGVNDGIMELTLAEFREWMDEVVIERAR